MALRAEDWTAVAAAAKAAGDLEVARPEVAAAREMLKHRGDVDSCAARLQTATRCKDRALLSSAVASASSLVVAAHCSACTAAEHPFAAAAALLAVSQITFSRSILTLHSLDASPSGRSPAAHAHAGRSPPHEPTIDFPRAWRLPSVLWTWRR